MTEMEKCFERRLTTEKRRELLSIFLCFTRNELEDAQRMIDDLLAGIRRAN